MTKPCKDPIIKEASWNPPPYYWIKCNTDGTYGDIFRDRSATSLGCFSLNLGITFALHAELTVAKLAIEIAYKKGWHNFWLEFDSQLVVITFKIVSIVPWQLKNRWRNCLELTSNMCFMFFHSYKEGNHCADKIASLSFSFLGFHWWDIIPRIISEDFFYNRVGLPNYRFK